MLNRIHDIRESSKKFFGEIIDPLTAIKPDLERSSDFVQGHADIVTAHNSYKLSIFSPQAAQPPGAPSECASLGSVVFRDPLNDTTIMGSRSDRTFLDIARHLGHREYTDRIAHARRELAESGPDAIKAAQEKLGALVSAAARFGVVIDSVPMATAVKTAPVSAPASAPAQVTHVAPTATAVAAPVMPVEPADEPMIGLPVVFIHNPGEGSAGMTTVPGIVTRVWDTGQIGLQMFVDDHDVQHRPKVQRRGADAGNGRVHTHGCWDLSPWFQALIGRLDALERSLSAMEALAAENKQLSDRLASLEAGSAKPRRGRPAKPEGGEAEAAELVSEAEQAGREPELLT